MRSRQGSRACAPCTPAPRHSGRCTRQPRHASAGRRTNRGGARHYVGPALAAADAVHAALDGRAGLAAAAAVAWIGAQIGAFVAACRAFPAGTCSRRIGASAAARAARATRAAAVRRRRAGCARPRARLGDRSVSRRHVALYRRRGVGRDPRIHAPTARIALVRRRGCDARSRREPGLRVRRPCSGRVGGGAASPRHAESLHALEASDAAPLIARTAEQPRRQIIRAPEAGHHYNRSDARSELRAAGGQSSTHAPLRAPAHRRRQRFGGVCSVIGGERSPRRPMRAGAMLRA